MVMVVCATARVAVTAAAAAMAAAANPNSRLFMFNSHFKRPDLNSGPAFHIRSCRLSVETALHQHGDDDDGTLHSANQINIHVRQG